MIPASILLPYGVCIKATGALAVTFLRAIRRPSEDFRRITAGGSDTRSRAKSDEQCSHEGIGIETHRSGIGSVLGWSDSNRVFVEVRPLLCGPVVANEESEAAAQRAYLCSLCCSSPPSFTW